MRVDIEAKASKRKVQISSIKTAQMMREIAFVVTDKKVCFFCFLFFVVCYMLFVHCSLFIVHCSLFIVHCSFFFGFYLLQVN